MMDTSRLTLALALMALGACETTPKFAVAPSTERPTPVPVVPVAIKLAFAPAYASGGILTLGASLKPDLVLVTDMGESVAPRERLSFRSSNPEFVTVDSGGTITAKAMGSAWIVASLPLLDHVLRDSIQITVRCTLELWIDYNPPTATLRVGESFVPSLTLWTCGRRVQVEDAFWWRPHYPTDVVHVDSASGKTTALKPGQAWLIAIGQRGNGYPALPVTVIP